MTASYAERAITLTIQIGQGAFGEGGFDTVTLAGHRVEAQIDKSGSPSFNTANVRIYGLTLSMMNRLSTLGQVMFNATGALRRNNITVTAGDAASGMAVVFQGGIVNAYPDFEGAPDVSFNFVAATGALEALKPIPPSSFTGAADVAIIMSGLATQMGLKFENSGVSGVMLSNPYLSGTGMEQARRCAEAAGINMTVDDGTLAIWPAGGSRGGGIPLISPTTGLVGYPRYEQQGPVARALLNPAVSFGAMFQLQSSLTPACGTWYCYHLTYDLASQTPDGPWFMTVSGLGNYAPGGHS